MGFLLILSLSLLFTTVAPLKEVPNSSCSSQFNVNQQHHNTTNIHLTLHHPRSPCSPSPSPPLPFSTILHHDDNRVDSLASRIFKTTTTTTTTTTTSKTAATGTLTPGAAIGVGNYITTIHLGTPSVPNIVVVDTGSSLSWIQCSPCSVSCHDQTGPVFDPTASKSYRSIPCSSPSCSSLPSATLNPSSCTKSNICVYEASYGDSSFSVGLLSSDTLSFASSSLSNFVYGCGQDNEGLFGSSAGLIGLAKNKLSFLSQLAPVTKSNSFSYCLPTKTSSGGYLSFGPYTPSKFSFTPMASSSLDSTLYFINIMSITVAGKTLPISSSTFKKTPTIIDSGTVITRLPADVYSALSKAVTAGMKNYKKVAGYSILDTCFAGSVANMKVPEVVMVFSGGAAMKLSAKNVMIDVDDDTTCLAFATAGRVAIVGNRQQQTFSVVYDIAKAQIGFAAGGCS